MEGGRAPDSVEGQSIAGRYRLVSRLGAGGMGRVWLARDTKLDSDVALKEILLPPTASEAEWQDRLARVLREARTAAQLRDHPHVVTILDILDDAGLPWIVMELVDGRSLSEIVREKGPMPPEEVARIGAALVDALDAAHQLGILHRDVKPGNVLITPTGRVVLTDFGLAQQEGDPSLTGSALIGSPEYIAPERARGEQPSPAVDMFSVGATLYFMVEGHSPFRRESPTAVLTALLFDEPPPPTCPAWLSDIILGLLRKDPAQRTTAAGARGALTAAGTDPATQAQPHVAPTIRQNVPPMLPPGSVSPSGPSYPSYPSGQLGQMPMPGLMSATPPPGPYDAPTSTAGGLYNPYGPRGSFAPPYGPSGAPPAVPPQGPPRRNRRVVVLSVVGALVVIGGIVVVAVLLSRPKSQPAAASFSTTPTGPNTTPVATPTTEPARVSPSPSASPSSTASLSVLPPSTPTPTPTPSVTNPADVVTAYYNAIDNRDYQTAWRLGGDSLGQTYQQFSTGFQGLTRDYLSITGVSGDVVNVLVISQLDDGSISYYTGSYVVQNGLITGGTLTSANPNSGILSSVAGLPSGL